MPKKDYSDYLGFLSRDFVSDFEFTESDADHICALADRNADMSPNELYGEEIAQNVIDRFPLPGDADSPMLPLGYFVWKEINAVNYSPTSDKHTSLQTIRNELSSIKSATERILRLIDVPGNRRPNDFGTPLLFENITVQWRKSENNSTIEQTVFGLGSWDTGHFDYDDENDLRAPILWGDGADPKVLLPRLKRRSGNYTSLFRDIGAVIIANRRLHRWAEKSLREFEWYSRQPDSKIVKEPTNSRSFAAERLIFIWTNVLQRNVTISYDPNVANFGSGFFKFAEFYFDRVSEGKAPKGEALKKLLLQARRDMKKIG